MYLAQQSLYIFEAEQEIVILFHSLKEEYTYATLARQEELIQSMIVTNFAPTDRWTLIRKDVSRFLINNKAKEVKRLRQLQNQRSKDMLLEKKLLDKKIKAEIKDKKDREIIQKRQDAALRKALLAETNMSRKKNKRADSSSSAESEWKTETNDANRRSSCDIDESYSDLDSYSSDGDDIYDIDMDDTYDMNSMEEICSFAESYKSQTDVYMWSTTAERFVVDDENTERLSNYIALLDREKRDQELRTLLEKDRIRQENNRIRREKEEIQREKEEIQREKEEIQRKKKEMRCERDKQRSDMHEKKRMRFESDTKERIERDREALENCMMEEEEIRQKTHALRILSVAYISRKKRERHLLLNTDYVQDQFNNAWIDFTFSYNKSLIT